MAPVGFVILCGGTGVLIRVERLEGFRHLFDSDWILNDRARKGVVSGGTATVLKLIARVMLAVGAALLVLGLFAGA